MIRITPQDIDKAIASAEFQVHARRLTVCVLTLQNGFLVTGESSCNDPAEFDGAKSRAFALTDAREKVGAFLAYAARELTPRPVAETVDDLGAAMRADAGFAWSWHCNIAMAFQDAATDAFMAHDAARVAYVANDAAARFMKQAFGAAGYAPGSMSPRNPEVSDEWGRVHTAESLKRAREVEREKNAAMTQQAERMAVGCGPKTAEPLGQIRILCVHRDGCPYVAPCQSDCKTIAGVPGTAC